MTEMEWLTATDPRLSLIYLEDKSSQRKARLFTCAVGRALWPYLGNEHSCRVVEVAERYADNLTTENELQEAETLANNCQGWAGRVASCAGDNGAWQGARMAMVCLQRPQTVREGKDLAKRVVSRSRHLLSCIFGNPFRPISLEPSWLTSTVQALATGIYEEKAFDRMPILADALQDAGCNSEELLNHCRGEGVHVRGCFVVDLILGKQ